MLLAAERSRAAFDCESAAIAAIATHDPPGGRRARGCDNAGGASVLRSRSEVYQRREVQDNRGAIVTRGDHMATTTTEIAWGHDFERALTDAKVQRKLVLIDFTAAPM